jgi:hypothetical protein
MAINDALLVEGNNDKHVFFALLKHHQIPQSFKVVDKEGIDNLLGTLATELKSSDRQHLGIVIDANSNLAARWAALRNILLDAGAGGVPLTPASEGSVVKVQQPDRTLTVGIWLMPDNQLPGMLENFVAFLVPQNDTLWDHAGDALKQLPEFRFTEAHRPKAHIHTWLAWQEEPGTPLGLAITKRYLDANAPHVHALLTWIRRVFSY